MRKQENKGITLIVLVITIITLLILAGVSIVMLIGENGILTQAQNAKVLTEISALKEEIDLYKVGEELKDIKGIDKYPIVKEETMESLDKNLLSIELKQKMSKWANKAKEGEIATIETIDYSKFYKIDKEKIQSAKKFEGDLYLVEVNGEYKVISIEGVIYQKDEINIIIPLNDISEPEYITVGNNTFKWYGNGDLSVIGELNSNSGITSEENSQINGVQELKIRKIANESGIVFDDNVETQQNIAKINGVKKIYFNTGTIYIIDANDDLWAWGANDYNKLGQGNSYLITEPTKILEKRTEGVDGVKAKNVWAGPTNTFVLDTENRLWACGANSNGVLGQGNNNVYQNFVEIKIDGLDLNTTKIEDISLTFTNKQYVSAIIKCNDGKVYGAGRNNYGGFGIGTNQYYNKFIELSAYNEIWKKANKIVNEGISTYIITNEGELYSSGYNAYGRLCLGHTNNVNTLTKVTDNVKDMIYSTSEQNIIFLKNDGYLYTNNSSGNMIKIDGIQDSNAKFLGGNLVLSEGNVYRINNTNKINEAFINYEKISDEIYFGYMERNYFR